MGRGEPALERHLQTAGLAVPFIAVGDRHALGRASDRHARRPHTFGGDSGGGDSGDGLAGSEGGAGDGPEFYDESGEDLLDMAREGKPYVGWVTLRKECNKKLVTSRVKLGPGSRRQYHSQWDRRKENDKKETRKPGSLDVARLSTELTADPTGVGFGFGGVEPGVLHAHGKLHEVHKVSYSIGLSGPYLLHVRLRQQAMPIPGSPFLLDVAPAPAHGHASRLPLGPIKGMVGQGADAGCEAVLRTADKMGNMCIKGGAEVQISCDNDGVETEVSDKGDGSYVLKWRSKYSGSFKTFVTIDKIDCLGSPTTILLTSSTPELSKSELSGNGLKSAVAGDQTSIKIKFVDQYANVAIPPESMRFGMAFLKEKEKLSAAAACHPFEQEWEAGDTGICELKYVATQAGACGLHVWCDPNSSDERIPLPGSPFTLSVGAGKASPGSRWSTRGRRSSRRKSHSTRVTRARTTTPSYSTQAIRSASARKSSTNTATPRLSRRGRSMWSTSRRTMRSARR